MKTTYTCGYCGKEIDACFIIQHQKKCNPLRNMGIQMRIDYANYAESTPEPIKEREAK